MTDVADISVLIVAYKSRATMARCLDALMAQARPPRQILVLENGSPENERLTAADIPEGVEFVHSDDNLGFAAGNNLLARRAKARWLAFLNPDAFAHPDWIEQLERAFERYPDVTSFGSTQFVADETDRLDGTGDAYHALGLAYRSGYGRKAGRELAEGEVFAACGAAACVRRDIFEGLDGFDESLFCYNEDVDLGYRARLQGERVVQLAGARVDHLGYASSGRRSEFETYHGVRNRLIVFLRDTPGWLFWCLAPGHVAVTAALWLSSLRFAQGGVFIRAVGDALKRWPQIRVQRRELMAQRRASVWQIARMMSWSPLDLFTRKQKIVDYEPR